MLWPGPAATGSRSTSAPGGYYGLLRVTNGVTSQNFTDTASKMTLFNTAQGANGLSFGIVVDKANSKMTLPLPGKYSGAVHMSFSGPASPVDWIIGMYYGGVDCNCYFERDTSSTAIGSAGFSYLIETTSANTDIEIYGASDIGGGAAFLLQQATWITMGIGP